MSIQTIKSRRIAMSISQIEMSKMIGITQSTYSRYENNYDKIPLKVMKKMAHVFKVPLNDLLQESSNNGFGEKEFANGLAEGEVLTKSYFDQKINELIAVVKKN
jgi:transcriptional regulator with XRE-family HTH domain